MLKKLEKTATLQILAFLLKKGAASRTDLRNNIDAALETIYSTLPILNGFGLIKEHERKKFPFTITLSLTDKGRRIAEKLAEIEKVLEE